MKISIKNSGLDRSNIKLGDVIYYNGYCWLITSVINTTGFSYVNLTTNAMSRELFKTTYEVFDYLAEINGSDFKAKAKIVSRDKINLSVDIG